MLPDSVTPTARASDPGFLGRGWAFPPTFSRGGGAVAMVEGEADIAESLRILLRTRVGERVMRPRYGCTLDRLLFEPLSTSLRAYVEDLVRTAVLYFEPRVVLDGVGLTAVPEEGRLDIEVRYTVARTNSRMNLVFPFYLSEGTDAR